MDSYEKAEEWALQKAEQGASDEELKRGVDYFHLETFAYRQAYFHLIYRLKNQVRKP